MKTPVAITMTGVALEVGAVLGWSLRPKPDGRALSAGAEERREVVSAVSLRDGAEAIDDAPDPFRRSPPTVERLVSLWRAEPSRARALEFELGVLQMDAAELAKTWEVLSEEVEWEE